MTGSEINTLELVDAVGLETGPAATRWPAPNPPFTLTRPRVKGDDRHPEGARLL